MLILGGTFRDDAEQTGRAVTLGQMHSLSDRFSVAVAARPDASRSSCLKRK
jgi:hypothetical protein